MVITDARVGPIYIGMPIPQLRSVIGAKDKIFDFNGVLQVSWFAEDLQMDIRSDNKSVCGIDVFNKKYATQAGIHIYSTEADLRAAYGSPASRTFGPGGWIYRYENPSIQFDGQTKGDIVTGISIGQCPSSRASKGTPVDGHPELTHFEG
jgi:hypothetical protein